MKFLIPSALLILALIACGGTPPEPPVLLEVVKTPEATPIGSAQTLSITATGGSDEVLSAGAKIVVPAGAMPDGSSLTMQAIDDSVHGSGQGLRLTGDAWSQPITVQFSYPTDLAAPENFSIAVRIPNGVWIVSPKVNVDAINHTISARISPLSPSLTKAYSRSVQLKGSKLYPMDIIKVERFYLKPSVSPLQIGKTLTFTAYANVAIYSNSQSAQSSLIRQTATDPDDEELVPLSKVAATALPVTKPIDDSDEIVPLTIVKPYPFTNSKPGFTRNWSLSGAKLGSIVASGATNAIYTAPKDSSAVGKVDIAVFTSINDANPSKKVRIIGSILLRDEKKKLSGTVTFKSTYTYAKGGVQVREGTGTFDFGTVRTDGVPVYSYANSKTTSNASFTRGTRTCNAPEITNEGGNESAILIFNETAKTYTLWFPISGLGSMICNVGSDVQIQSTTGGTQTNTPLPYINTDTISGSATQTGDDLLDGGVIFASWVTTATWNFTAN
jgi:hypothetical protein